MDCERYAPYLAGYAGGDLRQDTTKLVAAHVGTCATCGQEAERQLHVVGTLRSLNEIAIPIPMGLEEDLMAGVRAHQHLGGIAAAVPLAVAERVRRMATDPRVQDAAGHLADASKNVSDKLTNPKTRAAAAATTAAVAGGIVALVSRRRRIARGTAPA